MGTDLILICDGKDVANLGRLHKYWDVFEYDEKKAENQLKGIRSENRKHFITSMLLHIMALNPESIEDIKYAIIEEVDYFEKECIKVGRTYTAIEATDKYSDLEIKKSF